MIFFEQALLLKESGNLMELVDERLGEDLNKEEAMVMIKVAFLCANVTPTLRPAMSSVISMLEGKTVIQDMVSNSSEALDEKKWEAMRQYYRKREEIKRNKAQNQFVSTYETKTAAFISETDLYSVNLD